MLNKWRRWMHVYGVEFPRQVQFISMSNSFFK
jgi:hypothetical protein